MLPEELTITLRPRRWIKSLWVSPLVVAFVFWMFYWPWGSSNAPGWVQAVGAIIAIIGAALFPYWHEAHKERRKAEQLRQVMLHLAVKQKGQLIALFETGSRTLFDGHEPLKRYLDGRHHYWWAPHIEALASIPVADLPPPFVMALGELKVGAAYARDFCARMDQWQVESQQDVIDLTQLSERADITQIVIEVLRGETSAQVPWLDFEGDQNSPHMRAIG